MALPRHRPRWALLSVSLLVFVPGLKAAATVNHKDLANYISQVWQTAQGLPQNSIQDIVQTRDGYIWIATQAGVARFDGVRFTIFNSENTPEIRTNRTTALFEDHQGNLWIGTANGLVLLKNGAFALFTVKDGLSDDSISAIREDGQETVWIGTDNGLNRFTNGQFVQYTTADGLPNNTIKALGNSHDGALWIGTNGGVSRFRNGTFTNYSVQQGLPTNFTRSVYEDPEGRLWVGTNLYLSRLEHGRFITYKANDAPHGGSVLAIHQDRHGTLWFGSNGMGLYQLNPNGRFIAYRKKDGLASDVVDSIYEDAQGNLWLGTDGSGLIRLSQRRFFSFGSQAGLAHDVAWAVSQDTHDDLWVGTNDGLTTIHNRQFTTYRAKEGLPSGDIYSVYGDREGNVWIATAAGLAEFRSGHFSKFSQKPILDFILALYEDTEGNMWIGGTNGLVQLKNGKIIHRYSAADGITNPVRAITEDPQGSLWLGTNGGGVYQMQNHRFARYTTKNGLSSDLIASVYADKEGSVWIGTHGGGLDRLTNGQFHHYGLREGLFDDSIYTILEDDDANLWMTSGKGIFRVSKKQLNDLATAKTSAITSIAYDASDGIENGVGTVGVQPGSWKARDGTLWFCTHGGVVNVNPKAVTGANPAPPVVVERLIADGKAVPMQTNLTLTPGHTKFDIDYTAFNFAAPQKLRFKYTLEGFDKSWMDAGTRRTAYYTNLPAGHYTFKVLASNGDGLWNETGASVSFYLQPHFYQTYGFYGLCIFGTVLSGTGLYRRRIRRLRRREQELTRIVDERTRDLARQRTFLRQILDINPSFIFAKDRAGRFTLVNRALADYFHAKPDTLIGKTDADIQPQRREAEAFRRDDLEVMNTLREKLIPEEPITDAEGNLHWLQTVKRPIVDDDGRANQILGVATDITGRKLAEQELRQYKEHLEREVAKRTVELTHTNAQLRQEMTERKELEEQLRQAQKMEAIGTLSGGIAHDFNNLLTVIKGYGRMVLDRVQHDPALRRQVEQIDEAAERAAALTSQLLAFSRRQVLQPKIFNLNELVVNLDKMLQRLIGEDIAMVTIPAPDLGSVKADSGQIEQVIMNLVVNARDAMPNGGKLTLETANVDLDEAYAREHMGVRPGRYVMLAVSDTGSGMDSETLSHVFEPFFTTKERGRGTGLGLSMVYGIVKQSEAHIWVYSEPGRGTTFKIYFPRVDQPTHQLPREQPSPATYQGTGTILLVEDDRQVRELASSILTARGYSVLVAETTQTALSICEKHPDWIDLLLTDVVMPGFSGRELANQVMKRRPGIKVVYMSGYTTNAIVHHGVLDAGTFFLQKPFTPTSLANKVSAALTS